METRHRSTNNFTGLLLVLFVAWLLFGNGIQIVLLLTQRLQERLQQAPPPITITIPTAVVPTPPVAQGVQPRAPLAPLAPLTLDPQPQAPQPAQDEPPTQASGPVPEAQSVPAPAAPAPPTTIPAAPVLPVPPAPAATAEPTGVPLAAEHEPTIPLNAVGEPDWQALADQQALQDAAQFAVQLHQQGFKP